MQKTGYKKTLYVLCSLSFLIFVLMAVVHFWSFNESFYRSEHSKIKLYGKSIAEHIGISDDDLDELTHFTLEYLNDSIFSNPPKTLNKQMVIHGELREVFTDDEKIHMVDVRRLNIASIFVGVICMIIFNVSMYLIIKKNLFKQFYLSNLKFYKVLSIIFAALGLWIAIDFNSFWNFFHHIFFAGNDLWILDLSKDILIMIVPPEFFFHLVTYILVSFIIVLVLYNLVLYFINKMVNENDQHRII